MLFATTREFINSTEEGQARSLQIFQNWQPTAGAEFKGLYGYADGSGGIAIVEVDSAATIARLCAPFTPWLQFTARPILDVQEAAAIAGEGMTFRNSIG